MVYFILMINCLQEPNVPLSSGADLPVPGHADDGMTVSMILLTSETEQPNNVQHVYWVTIIYYVLNLNCK